MQRLTTRQFITLVFEEAGTTPQMDVLPVEMLRALGEKDPVMLEVVEMLYEFEKPFIVDHSKYERAFGSDVTPHREAIRKTLDWYRKNPRDS